jgi:hypothetical protein
MKNASLSKLVKEILTTPNVTVTKGTVGGASIEVFVKTPYEDKGSLIYKTTEDRDNDFVEVHKLINASKN